ncbi:hypothetical protein NKJ90_31795 [Mesorhizobium sp. M0051]|uniref:hypothetical protein n=1 Tax=Mesorhizobium sp. M0051 TaxID=2956862 RepID=UPI003336E037
MQSQMARSQPPPDRNGKKLKLDFVTRADDDDEPGGSQRSHDVYLLVAQAEYLFSHLWPRFSADAKRVMLVQNLTAAENMSASIQPAIFAFEGVSKYNQAFTAR